MIIFREKVFNRLVENNRVSDLLISKMRQWHYSGFSVYNQVVVEYNHSDELETMTQYIVHPTFFANKIKYNQDTGSVIYKSRMPEKKMKERKFLEKFVGEYDLRGIIATVAIKGENTMMLTVPGQPQYELVPYKGTEFTIKNLKGFSIKFIMDESGTVTELEFHQPNGVFTAKKKIKR